MSKVRLTGATSGYTEITAPATAGNNTITLPASNGTANQLLKNSGTAGALEYATATLDSSGNLNNIASINSGPLAGFRNAIINGNFDVWQRGTSFTGNEYGADRWLHARTGTTHTASRQAFALGQVAVPNEPTYFCRTVVGTVAGAGNYSLLSQRIEDVRSFAGQQITISFWAKADATKNIAVDLEQAFATGGSPSATVSALGVTKVSIGASWQKVTVTTTLPSISGKTLGTDNNSLLNFNIWFDAGSNFNARTNSLGQQSGTFDIAQVQVEAGPVATPFERRPLGTELALCERYYQIRTHVVTTTSVYSTVPLRQPMRVQPNISVAFDGGTGATFTLFGTGSTEALYQSTNHNGINTATLRLSAEL